MRTIEKIEGYVASEKWQQTIMSGLNKYEQDITLSIIFLRDNEYIQKMATHRNTLSEKSKKDIYDGWSIGLFPVAKKIIFGKWPIPRAISVLFGKTSVSHEMFDNFAIFTRMLVHLGVLHRPTWLTDDVLRENIASDANGTRTLMVAAEWACTLIPELRPALPLIKRAKSFILLWSLAQERIAQAVVNTPHKDVVTTWTHDALYTAFSEVKDPDSEKDPYAEAA